MASIVVSHAVRGMPEEESDEESSSWSNDDEHADQVREVVRRGTRQPRDKTCHSADVGRFQPCCALCHNVIMLVALASC